MNVLVITGVLAIAITLLVVIKTGKLDFYKKNKTSALYVFIELLSFLSASALILQIVLQELGYSIFNSPLPIEYVGTVILGVGLLLILSFLNIIDID